MSQESDYVRNVLISRCCLAGNDPFPFAATSATQSSKMTSHSKIKVIGEFSAAATAPIDERDHVREHFREKFSGIQ
jgi:hypothetical protein